MFTVCDGNIVVCNHGHCFQDSEGDEGDDDYYGYFASGDEFTHCKVLLLADGGEQGEGSNQMEHKARARRREQPKHTTKKQRTNNRLSMYSGYVAVIGYNPRDRAALMGQPHILVKPCPTAHLMNGPANSYKSECLKFL